MPELPEVETVRHTLQHLVVNKQIVSVCVLWDNIISMPSVKTFQENCMNQTIVDMDRYGKYLIFVLDEYLLVSHLRMEGKFYYYPALQTPSKHTHVVFKFEDGSELHYHDTRKFGKMYLIDKSDSYLLRPPFSHLGYEPFDVLATPDYLKSKLKNRHISVKQALLDQTILVGLGNIYVDEVCFRCGIFPGMPVSLLKSKDYKCIITSSQDVLNKAIALGGTTIRTYESNLGVTGRFQNELNVHLRKDMPCYVCQTPIIKTKVATRGTYYCPKCQKEK